jgi:uncharacterized protein
MIYNGSIPSPSFDCEKKNSGSESEICSSIELSNMDRALSIEFITAKKYHDSAELKQLTTDHNYFISNRNACDKNRTCIRKTISERISELQIVITNKRMEFDTKRISELKISENPITICHLSLDNTIIRYDDSIFGADHCIDTKVYKDWAWFKSTPQGSIGCTTHFAVTETYNGLFEISFNDCATISDGLELHVNTLNEQNVLKREIITELMIEKEGEPPLYYDNRNKSSDEMWNFFIELEHANKINIKTDTGKYEGVSTNGSTAALRYLLNDKD